MQVDLCLTLRCIFNLLSDAKLRDCYYLKRSYSSHMTCLALDPQRLVYSSGLGTVSCFLVSYQYHKPSYYLACHQACLHHHKWSHPEASHCSVKKRACFGYADYDQEVLGTLPPWLLAFPN